MSKRLGPRGDRGPRIIRPIVVHLTPGDPNALDDPLLQREVIDDSPLYQVTLKSELACLVRGKQ
jgi:hypothetical protein